MEHPKNDKNTILLINNNQSVLDTLRSILAPDYPIITAASGEKGITRTLSVKPDLILLDVMMPSMNGFDIMDTLKKALDTSGVPIIMTSEKYDVSIEEKALNLGAVDFIAMPFNSAIIKARVKNQIRIIELIHTIEFLGMLDPLTNIRNRRSFNERLNIEWRRCVREKTPLSFLMIDVDKFKEYTIPTDIFREIRF